MILEELKFNLDRIDILLQERGRTRADLARALGKSYNTVKAMLNRKNVTTHELEKIADYLMITILEFIDGPEGFLPLTVSVGGLSEEVEGMRKRIKQLEAENSKIMRLEDQVDTQIRYIKLLEEKLENVNQK